MEALIPRSNQGCTPAAARIHIILHFNRISIDLHLLSMVIIAQLVDADRIGLLEAGPLPLNQSHPGPLLSSALAFGCQISREGHI